MKRIRRQDKERQNEEYQDQGKIIRKKQEYKENVKDVKGDVEEKTA